LLYKIYKRNLISFYFNVEKVQFFSTLLSNEEKYKDIKDKNHDENINIIIGEDDVQNFQSNNQNNISEKEELNKIIINEFENICLKTILNHTKNNKKLILEQNGMNELNIILGLNLPGIKPILDSVCQRFKAQTLLLYRQNENILRVYENWDEETINKRRTFFDNLYQYNNSTYYELLRNKILLEVLHGENNENNNRNNENNKKEEVLFNLFFDDYYTLFIYEKIYMNNNKEKKLNQDDFSSIKKFLELILNIRNNSDSDFKYENIIENTANKINWIEAYSEELTIILTIFLKLNYFINNLYDKIIKVFEDCTIKYESSERNRNYSSLVNKAIFFGIESIIRVVTSNENIYINLKNNKEKFSHLIKVNKKILQEASKFQMNLNFYSNEILSLQEILLLNDCFNKNNLDAHENITKLIKYFSDEIILINNEQEDELIDNFIKLYNDLNNKIGNDKSFYQMMSIIFKNVYYKIPFDSFRNEILNIILKNNEFIINNYQIFKFIIQIGDDLNEMEEYLEYIQESYSILIKTINEYGNNEFLEQIIINIFENKILTFFNNIPNLDFNNEDIKNKFESYSEDRMEINILHDLPQTIFKKCLQILEDIYEKDDGQEIINENICKLYAISYIKIYLNKLIYLIYYKDKEIKDIQDIINIIKGNEASNKLRKIIKIYVFKLFFNLMYKNWDEFTQFDFSNRQIDFIDILLEEENETQFLYLTKYLLPSDSQEFEKMNNFFNEYEQRNIKDRINISEKFIKKMALIQ